MKVIAVDDEEYALTNLVNEINKIKEISECKSFTNPLEAIEYMRTHNETSICFLDIEMPEINGLEAAKLIRETNKGCAIIFVTGFSEYASSAFQIHAGGYLMKPVTSCDIEEAIDYLKKPYFINNKKRVRVQTFGTFSVSVDDVPVTFKYSKSLELFAYLVDRKGASCSTNEIIAVLWEDEPDSPSINSYLRNIIADMTKTFAALNTGELFVKSRGRIALLTEKIDCDYYRYLDGDNHAINAYMGEYMTNYSWAEFTLAEIESRKS